MGDRVKQTFGLCLMFRLIFSVLALPIYEDEQLYVGSPCTLAGDKGSGICTEFEKCSSKMQEVREGNYDQADRCGFQNFTEIVCCSSLVNVTEKLTIDEGLSPAEAACREYGNEVLVTEKKVGFNIYNGEDAEPNEFPHMVALGYPTRPDDDVTGPIKYTCGGTLVSRQHVLTAAHCVNNRDESVPVEVRLGSTDLSEVEENTQRVPVLSVTPHPGYKRSRNYNDIAIITLQEPVRLTNSVHPACLMTKSVQNFTGTENQKLVVTGWGSTEFGSVGSPKLKKAVGLRFVEFDECSKSYVNKPTLPNGLEDTMLCATDSNTTRLADPCGGDSGGPLLVTSSNARPVVAGVTAFGEACGGSTPGVYTSVFSYLKWIEDQVWPSSGTEPSTKKL